MAVTDGTPAGVENPAVADGEDGRRPTWLAVCVFVVVVLVSGATVTFAATLRGPEKCQAATQVELAAGGLFFEDPEVQRELACRGLRVAQTGYGSRGIATADLDRYDAAEAASSVAAEAILERLRREKGKTYPRFNFFSSPLVIVSFKPIAGLLEKAGAAKPNPDGTWTFDVKRYLDLVAAKTNWQDLPGNGGGAVYGSPNRVLLSTTDPALSNSGYMLIAIVSYVLNGNAVVTDEATVNRLLPRIVPLFRDQGALPHTTPRVLERLLQGGIDAVPIGLAYENDYITYIANKPPGSVPADIVLMYPNPTVLSDGTLIPLTDKGTHLIELLRDIPAMSGLAIRNGLRSNYSPPEQFVQYQRGRGVAVAERLTLVNPPSFPILESFVHGLG